MGMISGAKKNAEELETPNKNMQQDSQECSNMEITEPSVDFIGPSIKLEEPSLDQEGRPSKEITMVRRAIFYTIRNKETMAHGTALLDTGAWINVMGYQFALKNKMSQCMVEYKAGEGPRVKLGGTTNIITCKGYINIKVMLDNEEVEVNDSQRTLTLRFEIIDTDRDAIIGLTDMVKLIPEYTIKLFKNLAIVHGMDDTIEINSMDEWLVPLRDALIPEQYQLPTEDIVTGDLVYPWANVMERAPEDEYLLEEDMPATIDIHGMDLLNSYIDRKKEYNKILPAALSKDITNDREESKKWKEMLESENNTKAFCFDKWTGIRMEPIKLETLSSMPERHSMPSRHINHEFKDKVQEMIMYYVRMGFYVMRSSATVSGMVAVRKPNGSPRICSDFRWVNKHLVTRNAFLPNVKLSIEKMKPYTVFGEMDYYKAYHQFPLCEETKKMLAMITPWGVAQPNFLPEGVAPASSIMQETVDKLFHEVQEFAVTIADNIIIGAHSIKDLREKTQIILNICTKANIILSIEKCSFGSNQIKFFGYLIGEGYYTIDEEKRSAAANISMPKSMKSMRSFLGLANFFAPFIPRMAERATELHSSTTSQFNWKDEAAIEKIRPAFEDLKKGMVEATEVWFPDRNYTWILRTDASMIGVGAVLLQAVPRHIALEKGIIPKEGEDFVMQPIWYGSSKFSKQAQVWSTIEQETFAIIYAVKQLKHYLALRPFILESDHANILYLEKSDVPKLVRWRLYLQEFPFILRHIPGRQNVVADYYSRIEKEKDNSEELIAVCMMDCLVENTISNIAEIYALVEADLESRNQMKIDEPEMERLTQEQMFKAVHTGRVGHVGVQRTYQNIKARYPTSIFPLKAVQELVAECIYCQKFRLADRQKPQEVRKYLHVDHTRATVCMDILTLKRDKYGFKYLMVMINHATKRGVFYPGKVKDAEFNRDAILYYIKNIGMHDTWWSDPGSEFDNGLNKELNDFLGIQVKFTMVNRPEANGVERTNGKILEYLRPLLTEEQATDRWSELGILAPLQMHMNNRVNEETGYTPNELTFGLEHKRYNALPSTAYMGNNKWVKEFSEYIQLLREKALTKLKSRQADRVEGFPDEGTRYAAGDFIFVRNNDTLLKHKFMARNEGPYEVISQVQNNVETKHLVTGKKKTYHANVCRLFVGSNEDAIKLAREEADEHEIEQIVSHTGNILRVNTTQYTVNWTDGTSTVEEYKNIMNTDALNKYSRTKPFRFPLSMMAGEFAGWKRTMNNFRQEQWISQCRPDQFIPTTIREAVFLSIHYLDKASQLEIKDFPEYEMEDRVLDAIVVRMSAKAKSIDLHIPALDKGKVKCICQLNLADILLYVRKVTRRSESPEIIIIGQRDIEKTNLKHMKIKENVWREKEERLENELTNEIAV